MIQSANSASVQSLNSLGRSGSSQMSPIHNKCSYFISVIRFRVSSNTYIQLAIVGCQLDLQSQRCPVFIIILPSIRLAASSDTCNLYNWGLTSVTITQQPGPVNSADETSCKSKSPTVFWTLAQISLQPLWNCLVRRRNRSERTGHRAELSQIKWKARG